MGASGSATVVHTTSQIATVIGAATMALCTLIWAVTLGVVIIHDGNTTEVTAAMQVVSDALHITVPGAVILAGAAGAVSAFVTRSQNGAPTSGAVPPVSPTTPASIPASIPATIQATAPVTLQVTASSAPPTMGG